MTVLFILDRPLKYVSDFPQDPEKSESTLATDININRAIIEIKAYQNNPIELYKEKPNSNSNFIKKLCEEYVQLLNISAYRKNK